jgi:hypothetical protein
MRLLQPWLTDYRGALDASAATPCRLLRHLLGPLVLVAFRAADDLVVRLTFLAVFFALAAKSDIESIMCSNSDLSACISPSPFKE